MRATFSSSATERQHHFVLQNLLSERPLQRIWMHHARDQVLQRVRVLPATATTQVPPYVSMHAKQTDRTWPLRSTHKAVRKRTGTWRGRHRGSAASLRRHSAASTPERVRKLWHPMRKYPRRANSSDFLPGAPCCWLHKTTTAFCKQMLQNKIGPKKEFVPTQIPIVALGDLHAAVHVGHGAQVPELLPTICKRPARQSPSLASILRS